MNVDESQLRQYLEIFHRTYRETAQAFIPPEKFNQLLRYSFLESGITGYVSTSFGAGFEYAAEFGHTIRTKHASLRIEDFLIGAPAAVRKLPAYIRTATFCSFERVKIIGCPPLLLSEENASARLVDVTIEIGSWNRKVEFAEMFGNRSAAFWSEANAIARAKDEILLALSDISQARKLSLSLSDYLTRFKERTVLILGDYKEPRKSRLLSIKQAVNVLGYNGILLDDIPDDLHYSLPQKAVAIGSVCRFVVFDDSSKSGHLIEIGHAQTNNWLTVILREEGSDSSFMSHGASATSRVIREMSYTPDNLNEVLNQASNWAEQEIARLKLSYVSAYPWRQP